MIEMEESKGVSITDLEQSVIRQIEYYFGDYNLPRDKFLQEQVKLDDGWIPLSTMLNFKRLAALTKDEDSIIGALKKSTTNLMEIDEEKKKIRRSTDKPTPQMTESRHKEFQSRTVYCKGFTKENATLDKLLEYFSKFGSIENVQMRSYLDKATNEYIFKGSVFVLFSKKDEVDEFFKKQPIEYDGVILIVKKQEEYFIDKKKEREEKKRIQRAKLQLANNKQPQQTTKKAQDEEGKDSEDEEEEEEKGTGFAKGAVLHFKDVPTTATWEDIKSAVEAAWRNGAKEGEDKSIDVAYVDYRMGEEEGWIRMAEPNTALKLLERAKIALACRDKTKSEEKDKTTIKGKEEVEEKELDKGSKKESEDKEEIKEVDKEESKEIDKKESKEIDKKENKEMDKKESGEVGEKKEKDEEQSSKSKGEEEAKEGGKEVNGKDESGGSKESKGDNVMEVEEGGETSGCEAGSTAEIEICGTLVVMRALQGSEEDVYLEKAKGAREKRFMTGGKNRNRGGGRHGGSRRGRGGRGGKRKHNWDNGPSYKRRR